MQIFCGVGATGKNPPEGAADSFHSGLRAAGLSLFTGLSQSVLVHPQPTMTQQWFLISHQLTASSPGSYSWHLSPLQFSQSLALAQHLSHGSSTQPLLHTFIQACHIGLPLSAAQ